MPRNARSKSILREGHLFRHPSTNAEDLPYIAGTAILF
jgi:hypothetical protein